MWHGVGRVIVWGGIVLALPWATFFVIDWVGATRKRTRPGQCLSLGYTVLDSSSCSCSSASRRGRCLVRAGGRGRAGGVAYNLLICDWVAENGLKEG